MLIKIIALFCFCSASQAQDPIAIRRLNDQIVGRELQRQEVLKKNFRELSPPKYQGAEPEKAPETPNENPVSTFQFQEILLEGGHLLSTDEQKELVQDFLSRPLLLDDINKLLGKITNFYVEKGHITARAYLKPQNLKQGVLRITLVEGSVESLKMLDNGKKRTGSKNALPDIEGKPLNMRDLEQGIDNINRLATYDAKMELKPASGVGGSHVLINTKVDRPWSFSVAKDNFGSKATGQNQLELQGQYDDLLGLHDSFALTYRRDLALDDESKRSRSFTGQFSVPMGYWMLRLNGSTFEYLTTIRGQLHDFRFTGNSQNYKGELERIIHRDDMGKTGISGGLSYRLSDNYIADSLLITGSQRLFEGTLRVFHLRRLLGGVFNGSLSYGQGFRLFGATKESVLEAYSPKAQFKRGAFELSYMHPFQVFEEDFSWSAQTSYQYSPDTLFSVERVNLGGSYTVRGFQETSISGDSGGYGRIQISWTFLKPQPNHLQKLLGTGEVFGAFDAGKIQKDPNDPFEGGMVKGVTLGFRLSGGFVFGEMILSKSLMRPWYLKDEGTLLNFKMGIKF